MEYILGDVRIPDDVARAVKGIDIVFHLAAETGTGQSMYEIARYTDTNVNGTAQLLDELAQTDRVQKIILTSSRAVYGEGKYLCEQDGVIYPFPRPVAKLRNHVWSPCCPICGSLRVSGNTQSEIGIQSWECKNPKCFERSASDRGKRFSLKTNIVQNLENRENGGRQSPKATACPRFVH